MAKRRKQEEFPVFEAGQKIADTVHDRSGEIIDVARQYAHPNADPVHNYLVRWDDGDIEALNERAFARDWGLETVD